MTWAPLRVNSQWEVYTVKGDSTTFGTDSAALVTPATCCTPDAGTGATAKPAGCCS
ncbi:hypothetical protein [Amycolatopsis sp. NPDC049159]|uniref:hypothetical protein n=1 Tax=Amycolatopsis sp. NPDC049159 TaxID=3157210 RepID=UPI0033D7FD8F